MDTDNDYMELKRHEVHQRLKSKRSDRDLLPLFEAMAQAATDGDDFVYDVAQHRRRLGAQREEAGEAARRLERLGFIRRHSDVVLIHPHPTARAKLSG